MCLCSLCRSGAHRAARRIRPRPGVDHAFPNVSLPAAPPDSPVAALGQGLRRNALIQRGVPLPHQARILARKIVEPRPRLLPRAVGTARPLCPTEHRRLIVVSLFALPPDPLHAPLRDLPGREPTVFPAVPLRRQIRTGGDEIRLTGDGLFPRSERAAAPLDQRRGQRLPRVTSLAPPPEFPVGAGHHIRRRETLVSSFVPELCHFRVAGGKVVLSRQQPLAAAVGTAPPQNRPGTDRTAPPVPPVAAPPDLPVASAEDVPG